MTISRILLDANALLNAVFVPKSWSAIAVNEAAKRRIPVVLGAATKAEAIRVARETSKALRKTTDPLAKIEGYVTISRFLVAQAIDDVQLPLNHRIPKKDIDVYKEAVASDATLLTSDASLWAACGTQAVLPLQALHNWFPETIALHLCGITPGPERGSIFFRGQPNWSTATANPKSYVVDFSGRLVIFYDQSGRSWVAEAPGLFKLSQKTEIDRNIQTIALSWSQGMVSLKVAGTEHPVLQKLSGPLSAELSKLTLGHSHKGEHHWNGTVKAFVMDDRPIGDGLWPKLKDSSELTPNPYDSDRLKYGIDRAFPF